MRSGILLRAAEIIEERGWVQGAYSQPDKVKGEPPNQTMIPGAVCASRAISLAVDELKASPEQKGQAREAVASLVGTPCISAWNDKGKTSRQIVLETLRQAAEKPP